MRVLLVEDNELDQEAIQRLLTDLYPDSTLITLTSGKGLENELSSRPFDCVLIDYRLPGLSGLDLIQRLAARPESCPPLIMLTGVGGEEVAVDALKAGAADYINKDKLTRDLLRIAIESAVKKHQLTLELAHYQQKLERLALIDELTNIGNRAAFRQEAGRRMAERGRHARDFCLIIVDLNAFKPVNDTFGHAAGDQVLQEVARRLAHLCRDTDSVFRIGGDEFAVLAEVDAHRECSDFFHERIRLALAMPIPTRGENVVRVGASIGTAVFPRDARNISELLDIADRAMYADKRASRPDRNALPISGRHS